jgi:NTP pyrophosphatase (non-canonical NTP hydrolase)
MNQNDSNSTVQSLRQIVADFVQERDWHQFHSPKNLSMSISIEAAELMEHFQWMDVETSRHIDDSTKQEIGEELADVLCYAFALANQLNLDLSTTLINKMDKNRKKYPADEYRGQYKKT